MAEPQEIRVVISATAAQLREALSGAKGDLGDLSTKIKEVPNSIKVDVDVRTAAAEQRLRTLRDIAKDAGKNINIRADADTGIAEAKLRLLERQAHQTEEAIAKAQLGGLVSGGAGGAGGAGSAGSSLLSGGLPGGLGFSGGWPGGLGLAGVAVAAPAITALVGSLTALAGSLGAATLGFGALGTAAAGVGAVGIGSMLAVLIPAKKAITDVMTAQDALQKAQEKYGADSKQAATAQKGLNAVMAEAGPAASKAGMQLGKLADQWTELSQGAQDSLFTKILTPALKTLETLLPTVAKIAKQSFDAIGHALEPVFKGLSSPAFRAVLVELGDAFARLAGPLITGFSNLMRAFFSVAVAAAPFVQQIAVAFEQWTKSFAASLAPGQHLNDLIGGLVSHLHSWWELAKELGKVMVTIFKAGADTGQQLVDQLTALLTKWDAWLNTSAGQERLHKFFTESADLLRAVARTLGVIAPLLASMATGLIPTFTTLLKPAAELLTTISHWVNGLSKDLPPVISALPGLAVAAGVLASWKLLQAAVGGTLASMLRIKSPGSGGGIFGGGAGGIEGVRGPVAPGSLANPISVVTEAGGGGLPGGAGGAAAKEEGLLSKIGNIVKTGLTVAIPIAIATTLAHTILKGQLAGGVAGWWEAGAIGALGPLAPLAIGLTKLFGSGGPLGGPGGLGNITTPAPGFGHPTRPSSDPLLAELGVDRRPVPQPSVLTQLAGNLRNTSLEAGLPGLGTVVTEAGRASEALNKLEHHKAGLQQTAEAMGGLSRQAARLGDVKMAFADKLGQQLLLARGNMSEGVKHLLQDLDKLPPGMQKRAFDGMVAMAHELQSKGLLSRQQMDNLLTYLDTHTKAGMQQVQTSVGNAMTSVFGSIRDQANKSRQQGGAAFDALTAGVKQSMNAISSKVSNAMASVFGNVRDKARQSKDTGTSAFNALTGNVKGDMNAISGKVADAMASVFSNVDKKTGQARDSGSSHIHNMKQSMGTDFEKSAAASAEGVAQIVAAINDALKTLNAQAIPPVKVTAAKASAAVSSVFKAGGGYIGHPGEKGRDEVPIVVGRGEAILNHSQQQVVNAALTAQGVGGLPDLFSKTTSPHYMAQGGFAGGGVAGAAASGAKGIPYVFPYGPGLSQGRTDMGTDWTGAGQIAAIGNAHILEATTGNSGWPGGGFILYQLKDGPKAGAYIYLAENIQPEVSAGQDVPAGQAIAFARGSSPWTESGWATSSGETLSIAHGTQDLHPAHSDTPEGIDFTNFILGLAHGVITGGSAFPGGPAAIPQIKMPDVTGGGKLGTIAKGDLKKVVDAGNKYVQAHAPSTSPGGVSGGNLTVLPGPAPKGALTWEVKAVEETDNLQQNSGGSAFGANVPLTGWSAMAWPLGNSNFGAAMDYPNTVHAGTELYISANHRTIEAPLVDIGAGSQGGEWSTFPQLVMGLYPAARDKLGLAPNTSPWLLDIGRVDGQPLHPASGIPLHGLGGFAGLPGFAFGGRASRSLRHPAYGSSTTAKPKTTKPKAPAKSKTKQPAKLPKLPTLKGLPGFDQTLLNQIDATGIAAGELGDWLGYIDQLHQSPAYTQFITNADGTQTINWGDPKGTLGHLTGLIDPATGQQTKSIWDRLREIGDPATASRLPPHHRGGAGTGPPTELGTESVILADLLSEQGLAGKASIAYGKWLPAMTGDIADGAKQIDWLTAATDTTTPWSKLGKVDFRSVYPMGNLRTTTGQIYQYTTDAQGRPHFKFQGNDMGPEIKKRAHEYKNLLARIEYQTERKEKLPKERRDREKAIRDRFDKARHNIDISSLRSTFDARQLVNDQIGGLTSEEQAIAATIPTSPPNSWKGDLRAWQEQHKLERLTVKEEFAHRKRTLRDLAARGGLQGRVDKSNALFGLRLGERAELTALTDLFGDKDVKLKDELRLEGVTRDADKKWLGGWLSKIKSTHGSEQTALSAATEAGGFGDRLKAFVDPMGSLSLGILQKQNIDIPALLREIAALHGTTLPGTTSTPGTVDQSALNALLTQQLQTTQQALALSQAQFGVFKNFEPLVEQRLIGTFASGIDFVPKTGLAIVHRGETITPDPGGPYGNRATATVHTADQPMELVLVMANDEKPMMRLIDARLNQKSLQIVSDRAGQRARLLTGVRRP